MDINGDNSITLPKTFAQAEIPVSHDQIPRKDLLVQIPHLEKLAKKLPKYDPKMKIGLLIGSNCPEALQPKEVISAENNGPYAVKYKHGWTVNGPIELVVGEKDEVSCNRIVLQEMQSVKECIVPADIIKMFEMDFSEKDKGKTPEERCHSREDLKFLSIVQNEYQLKDGHFEVRLPFRNKNQVVNSNKYQALQRADWQRKKMLRNEKYHQDYVTFINKLLKKGYAYKLPPEEVCTTGPTWYLPHHGIYHPKKPDKIRVVFDCSAKFNGYSLNDQLLQGPDLTNSLVGVLTRFREEKVALMGDIEAMFYQVKVPPEQHDHLRFLWWPEGDLQKYLQEYRMAVHVFGAISSPSVANFVLKKTADLAENKYGLLVANTLRRNLYVDDCLKSVKDVETAQQLVRDLVAASKDGGFHLTKFTSNSKEVLHSIPEEERSPETQACDLEKD